jgi:hypothetical protein
VTPHGITGLERVNTLSGSRHAVTPLWAGNAFAGNKPDYSQCESPIADRLSYTTAWKHCRRAYWPRIGRVHLPLHSPAFNTLRLLCGRFKKAKRIAQICAHCKNYVTTSAGKFQQLPENSREYTTPLAVVLNAFGQDGNIYCSTTEFD